MSIIPTDDMVKIADVLGVRQTSTPMPTAVHTAWRDFPAVYGTVRTPTAEQPWTAQDVDAAAEAMQNARALMDACKTIADDARRAYLTHLNQVADARAAQDPKFAEALAELPTDKDGFYALGAKGRAVETPVPGKVDEVLSAEYTLGAPQLSVEALKDLLGTTRRGRRQLRKLITTVEVVDTDALTAATASDPALAAAIRNIARAARPSIRVVLRKIKPAKGTKAS